MVQAYQQERMKRQLGSTRDLGASTTPEAAGKEVRGRGRGWGCKGWQ